ncbi:MAG: hypothetical protein IKR48_13840 [Kiritimatiellae bacterium]|nr:hypothetical protein [Kiritimatiellia bacterium]
MKYRRAHLRISLPSFENENNRNNLKNNLSLERGLTRPRSTRFSIAASYRQRKGNARAGWSAHLFQLLFSGCLCCFQNPFMRMMLGDYADAPTAKSEAFIGLRFCCQIWYNFIFFWSEYE